MKDVTVVEMDKAIDEIMLEHYNDLLGLVEKINVSAAEYYTEWNDADVRRDIMFEAAIAAMFSGSLARQVSHTFTSHVFVNLQRN